MRFPVVISLLMTFCLANAAQAATPGLEEMHRLLLEQQALIEQQSARLDSLEQELREQKLLVMAQQERTADQAEAVIVLKERTDKTVTELERVHQALVAANPARQNAGADALAQAGPMTASLEPVGTVEEEPELPFTITAGAEYLKAYSKSFNYLKSEGTEKDVDDENRNLAVGYKISLARKTPSGITWGVNWHYWTENQHSEEFSSTDDSVIALGPRGIDANDVRGSVDAERYYGDLYVRGTVAESSNWQMDILGGLRGGSFSQNISAESLTDITCWADSSTSYLGFGPMAGLDANWGLLEHIGLAAYIDTAMLLGESETDVISRDTGPIYHRNNSNSFDVVWMLTSRLGLDLAFPLGNSVLGTEIGLNVEYWNGLPDHVRMDDDIDPVGIYDDTDVLLIGPYLDLNWSF